MAMTTQEALLRQAAWTTGMSSDGAMFPVGAGSPGSSGWLSCSPSPRWPGQVQEGGKGQGRSTLTLFESLLSLVLDK